MSALAVAAEQLSERSRLRRFHAPQPGLTATMLEYLTDIDHNDHQAIVALAPRSRKIIGRGLSVTPRHQTPPNWP